MEHRDWVRGEWYDLDQGSYSTGLINGMDAGLGVKEKVDQE